MTNFKIIFPTGYQVRDILNDNIDVNIVLENGDVYYGFIATATNILYMVNRDTEPGFWTSGMFIVKNLSQATIREAIKWILNEQLFNEAFPKIGRLGENDFYYGVTFDEIKDMGTGHEMGF